VDLEREMKVEDSYRWLGICVGSSRIEAFSLGPYWTVDLSSSLVAWEALDTVERGCDLN